MPGAPEVQKPVEMPQIKYNDEMCTVTSLLKDINRKLSCAGPKLMTLWPAALLTIQEHRGWDSSMPVKPGELARARKCIWTGLMYMFHDHKNTIPEANEALAVVTKMIKAERAKGAAPESQDDPLFGIASIELGGQVPMRQYSCRGNSTKSCLPSAE